MHQFPLIFHLLLVTNRESNQYYSGRGWFLGHSATEPSQNCLCVGCTWSSLAAVAAHVQGDLSPKPLLLHTRGQGKVLRWARAGRLYVLCGCDNKNWPCRLITGLDELIKGDSINPIFILLLAIKLPPPAGAAVCESVSKCEGHSLADGHHLGRSKPANHVPAEHARSPGDEGLVLGLLH